MKILNRYMYNSSMDVNDAVEGLIDPRIYQYEQFFDVTTSMYFRKQPSEVIRAWKFFVSLIKAGVEPTLNVFYDDLNLPVILGPAHINRVFKKEPVLCLYVCEDSTYGEVIAIDFEMF